MCGAHQCKTHRRQNIVMQYASSSSMRFSIYGVSFFFWVLLLYLIYVFCSYVVLACGCVREYTYLDCFLLSVNILSPELKWPTFNASSYYYYYCSWATSFATSSLAFSSNHIKMDPFVLNTSLKNDNKTQQQQQLFFSRSFAHHRRYYSGRHYCFCARDILRPILKLPDATFNLSHILIIFPTIHTHTHSHQMGRAMNFDEMLND